MYKGVLIPVITPFNEDSTVDQIVLRELIDFYLKTKVHGLFVLGSSGQGPALSSEERRMVAEIIIEQVAGRVPVIVHVGCADTPSTVQLAKHAAQNGADAIGIIPPYYYCDAPQSAILEHFEIVAQAADLPIFIYENPKYCGISISPEFGVSLKKAVPHIRAMKVAYGAGAMADYVKLFPSDVSVFTGNADILGLVPFGVAGMINPPTSSVPELCLALFEALESKNYSLAVEMQEKVNRVTQMFIATQKKYGRGTIAETYRVRGIDVKRFPRWKSDPLPDDAIKKIRLTYRDVGITD